MAVAKETQSGASESGEPDGRQQSPAPSRGVETSPPTADQPAASGQLGEVASTPNQPLPIVAAVTAAAIGSQQVPPQQQQLQQQQPPQQQKQAAPNTSSSSSRAKQSKEEKAKERERRREEQLWRRHQIELQLKQRGIAVSPCGRWIKHNLKCGEGAYKRVFRGYDREQGRPIAWCELKFQVGKDRPAEREQVRKEVEMMIKCEHPNIVRYYDLFEFYFELEESGERGEKVKAIVIITEFMSEGTLKEKMKTFYNEQTREAVVDFNVFQSWMQQILEGLRHMHHKMNPPVIHRDLKPENVFIADGENPEEYYNIKIGDFGLATAKTQTRKTMLGTLGYMAPEMLQERYDEKVDIFAFGILIVEMVTNSIPYQECQNFLDVWQRIASNTPPKVLTRIESQDIRDVFFNCTHPLPDFRPTVEELLSLQIFNLKPIPIQLQLVRLSQTLKWQDSGDAAADGGSTLSGEPPKKVAANLRDQEPVEYSGDPNKFYHVADFRLVVNDRTLQQQMRILPGVGFEFQLDCFIDEDLETVVNSFADFAESDSSNSTSATGAVSSDQQKRLRQKLVSSIRHQLNYYRKKVLAGVWSHFMEKIRESEPEQDSETDASPIVRLGLQARRWAEAKRRTLKERDDYNAVGRGGRGSAAGGAAAAAAASARPRRCTSNRVS